MTTSKRVLIMDDDGRDREFLRYSLIRVGYSTSITPALPIDQLRDHGPVEVIITEVWFDQVDGFELLTQIRAEPTFAGTKIIVLTNPKAMTDLARAMQCGANRYVTKPYSPGQLIKYLSELIPDSIPSF